MDSLSRVHRLTRLFYYSAFVYECSGDGATTSDGAGKCAGKCAGVGAPACPVYMVELKISNEPNMSLCAIYEHHVQTTRATTMKILSGYMMWKFNHCQKKIGNVKPVRQYGRFTQVVANLDWIKSVIEVEFDYHVGLKECCKRENAAYLAEYKKTQFAGYGPGFCDRERPDLNISESNLAKNIFPADHGKK